MAPREQAVTVREVSGRWWPDWPAWDVWRLGLIFGGVGPLYFGTNAFLPGYLSEAGKADLISPALTALNLGQLPASFLLIAFSRRLAPVGLYSFEFDRTRRHRRDRRHCDAWTEVSAGRGSCSVAFARRLPPLLSPGEMARARPCSPSVMGRPSWLWIARILGGHRHARAAFRL
jgi:hypothetical protein